MKLEKRSPGFRRNESLEALLKELNAALGAAEQECHHLPSEPRFPIVLVVGAPRSGTTLLMQWLAASGLFAVPSNLLSRFYAAPYLGGRIQRLLVDPEFSYGEEFSGLRALEAPYDSNIGKTRGLLQPNEFWYFWRRYIPNVDPEWLTPEQERLIDAPGFRRGIAHIEAAFGKPFATKGIILQYNLRCLQRALGKVLFVHTRRHPFFNIQSLLNARLKYFGDEATWFSVKPRQYGELIGRSPVEQVAGQVYHTRSSIDTELAEMDERHGLTVDHESFCAHPAAFHARLRGKLQALGHEIPDAYSGPARFDVHDRVLVDRARRHEILEAYERLAGERLQLPE